MRRKTHTGKVWCVVALPAKRLTPILLVLAVAAGPAVGADFAVKSISSEGLVSREPVISETGVAAWSGYHLEAGVERSDIYTYINGKTDCLTEGNPIFNRSNIRPEVQSNNIAWVASAKTSGQPDWVLREVPSPQRDEPVPELHASFAVRLDETGQQIWEELDTNAPPAAPAPAPGTPPAAEDTNAAPAAAAADTNAAPAAAPPPAYPVEEPPTDESVLKDEARRAPSGDTEIFLWKGGKEILRVTRDYRNDLGPSVWNSLIAWQKAKGWPFGWEIMAWADGERYQLTTNFYYDMAPKVQGRQVVWYGWDGHDFEIFLHDFDQKTTQQITSNQYDDVSPVLWDGAIAWEGYAGIDADIFFWKDGKTVKLSENVEDDLSPRVWNGKVVWQGFDGDDFEIYLFDGEKTIKLTSNRYDDINPDIRDGLICWMGYHDNWDAEIFAWDLSGQPVRAVGKDDEYTEGRNSGRLTFNTAEDRDPRTAGGRVIWQTDQDGKSLIYLAEPK